MTANAAYKVLFTIALCMLPLFALSANVFTLGEVQFDYAIRPRGRGFVDVDFSMDSEVLPTDTILVTLPSGFDFTLDSTLIVNYATIPMAVVDKTETTSTVAITDLKVRADQIVTLEFDKILYPYTAADKNEVHIALQRNNEILGSKTIVGNSFVISEDLILDAQGFALTAEEISNAVFSTSVNKVLEQGTLSLHFNYNVATLNETVVFDVNTDYSFNSCTVNGVAPVMTNAASPITGYTRYSAKFTTPVTLVNHNVTLFCTSFVANAAHPASTTIPVSIVYQDTSKSSVSTNALFPAISMYDMSVSVTGSVVAASDANFYLFNFTSPIEIKSAYEVKFSTNAGPGFESTSSCSTTYKGEAVTTTTTYSGGSAQNAHVVFSSAVPFDPTGTFLIQCKLKSIATAATYTASVVTNINVASKAVAQSPSVPLPGVVPNTFGSKLATYTPVNTLVNQLTAIQISLSPIPFNIASGSRLAISAYNLTIDGTTACKVYPNYATSQTTFFAASISVQNYNDLYVTFTNAVPKTTDVVFVECTNVVIPVVYTATNNAVFKIENGSGDLIATMNTGSVSTVFASAPPVRSVNIPVSFVRTTVLSPAEITNLLNSMKKVITTPGLFYVKRQRLVSTYFVAGSFSPSAPTVLEVDVEVQPDNPADITAVATTVNTNTAALQSTIAADTGLTVQSIAPATIIETSATCSNGIKDGSETDVDCGGPECPVCANVKSCLQDSDCLSSQCDSILKICTGGGGALPYFPSDSGLKDWEIALIVLGCIIGAFLIVLLIVLLCKSGGKSKSDTIAEEEEDEQGVRLSTVEL